MPVDTDFGLPRTLKNPPYATPRRQNRAGRWWEQRRPKGHWFLQCTHTRCARFKPQVEFDKLPDGSFPLWCRHCTAVEAAMISRRTRAATMPRSHPRIHTPKTARGTGPAAPLSLTVVDEPTAELLTCGACRVERPEADFLLDATSLSPYCTACRKRLGIVQQTDYLSRAERLLFPDLVDYGPHVTKVMIDSEPTRYPGQTYYDLTPAQRNAVIALAKELLFQETGQDIRTKRAGERDVPPGRSVAEPEEGEDDVELLSA